MPGDRGHCEGPCESLGTLHRELLECAVRKILCGSVILEEGQQFRNNYRNVSKKVVLPGGRMDLSNRKEVESKRYEVS